MLISWLRHWSWHRLLDTYRRALNDICETMKAYSTAKWTKGIGSCLSLLVWDDKEIKFNTSGCILCSMSCTHALSWSTAGIVLFGSLRFSC